MTGPASEPTDHPPAPAWDPFDPARFERDLAERIAGMRAMVASMKTESDAEALRMLRDAFPGSDLTERVAALASRSR